MKKWAFCFVSLWLMFSVILSGCNFTGEAPQGAESPSGQTSPKDGEQASGGNAITLSVETEITDLNQFSASDNVSFAILNNVNEGLYRLDQKNEPWPAMAKGVDISKDGLTYTFTLRDGVKWSNGSPVTAADFKFAWLGSMKPETSLSGYAFILTDYIEGGAEYAEGKAADVSGIVVKDDKTLMVKLKNPTPFFLRLVSFIPYYPLNETFVKDKGKDFALKPENMLYNGPFVLTQFDPASGAVLEKNPNYWDNGSVKLDQVNIKVVKEMSTALNLYKAGELDRVNLSSADVSANKTSPEFGSDIEFATTYLQFNLKAGDISNPNIRKALQRAYDSRVLEQLLNNGSKGAVGLIPDLMNGAGGKSFRDMQGKVLAPDAAKAKELWAQGVKELGHAPKIKLLVLDDTVNKDVGTFLQSEFKKNLGAEIEIESMPKKARNKLMDDGNYQMAVTAWGADYDDAMTYLDLWINHTPYRGNYNNPKYDRLIAEAKKEADEAKRVDMLLQAEKMLVVEDAVVAPLFYKGHAFLRKQNIEGLVYHPYGASWDFKYAAKK
ncbi:peptide ABC transporter substrate-binding protein [Paenibacillus ehimensis]|uniref:peptide ABC transporter substrate-binding protein n=1 Tax=Paenibacillus ehimensis TaxID=79264 RepID=UPI003D2E63DF